MTAQDLKNAILQLAVQGKLVPQDPADEPASELLKRVKVEKAQLIKVGTLKKEKSLPPISGEEIPFDIPENWIWVRMTDIIGLISGQDLKLERYNGMEKGIPYITGASNIENGEVIINRWTESSVATANEGDLLISCKGTVGKMAFLKCKTAHIARQIMAIKFPPSLNPHFIKRFVELSVPGLKREAKSLIPGIARENLLALCVPLPPLTEQARIVTKIEELLPYIEEYDAVEKRLTVLNKKFPDQLRKSILQQAIMGKLTERDPTDEPASELLKRIRTEKVRLIKEGKLKKEKPLSPITADDIPFEVPDGWEWVRLQDAATAIVDCPHSTPKYLDNETGFYAIGTKGMNGDGEITRLFNVDESTYLRRTERIVPHAGDIVYSREGSIICRAVILPEEKQICLGQRVMLIRCNMGFVLKFLQTYLMSDLAISYLTQNYKGTGVRHINVADVCSLPIPIPPLAKQQRIAERVEELLAVCRQLSC